MDYLGLNIKKLRTEKKMTQKQLAKHLGVKHSVISLYENNKSKPSWDVLQRLTEIFSVSLDQLKSKDLVSLKMDIELNSNNPLKVEEPASRYERDETIRLDALERRVSELSRRLSALEKELSQKKGEDGG